MAQEEYIQSLKTAEATKKSVLVSVSAQSNSLADASRKKLLLLGMSKAEIEELAKRRQHRKSLSSGFFRYGLGLFNIMNTK